MMRVQLPIPPWALMALLWLMRQMMGEESFIVISTLCFLLCLSCCLLLVQGLAHIATQDEILHV